MVLWQSDIQTAVSEVGALGCIPFDQFHGIE